MIKTKLVVKKGKRVKFTVKTTLEAACDALVNDSCAYNIYEWMSECPDRKRFLRAVLNDAGVKLGQKAVTLKVGDMILYTFENSFEQMIGVVTRFEGDTVYFRVTDTMNQRSGLFQRGREEHDNISCFMRLNDGDGDGVDIENENSKK